MAKPEIAFRDIYNELTPPPMMSFGEPLPPVAQALENIQALIDDGKGQKLSFELEVKHDPMTGKGGFTLHTEKMTAQAGIEQTRFLYLLQESHEMCLVIPGIDQPVPIVAELLSKDEKKTLIYRARVFRKLRFLEIAFGVEFPIPPVMSNDDIATIDTVIRGITRGNVFSKMHSATLSRENVTAEYIESLLDRIGKPASFDHVFTLFGVPLVGPVLGVIMDSTIDNIYELRQIGEEIKAGKQVESIEIVLGSFSGQVTFYFKKSVDELKATINQLVTFVKILVDEEPVELAQQVWFPINGEVSSLEASEIAMAFVFLGKNPEVKLTIKVIGCDLSIDSKYWVVRLALIKKEQEDKADLAVVFINRWTGTLFYPPTKEEASRLAGKHLLEQILPLPVGLEEYGMQEIEKLSDQGMIKPGPKLEVEDYRGEPYEFYQLGKKYVVAAPGICRGRPTIKYTRLDVRHILGFLKAGDTPEQISEWYKIPEEAVFEAIEFASKNDCEASYA